MSSVHNLTTKSDILCLLPASPARPIRFACDGGTSLRLRVGVCTIPYAHPFACEHFPPFLLGNHVSTYGSHELFLHDGESSQYRNVLIEITDPFSWRLSDAHVTSADHTGVYTRFVTAGVIKDAVADERGFAERNASLRLNSFFYELSDHIRTTTAVVSARSGSCTLPPRLLLCRHERGLGYHGT